MKQDSLLGSLSETKSQQADSGPVECLGQTFANDAARRAHYTELLRTKLKEAEFRSIEGFPIGTDDAILELSNPPYYTACPNPWLSDFVKLWESQKDNIDEEYHREPFAADVSEGKNDPIYNAHSYHTKVPHKAIMRYILHYTNPGDIVFDGFCGTGMTGVAGQMCGDREAVESLGYKVDSFGCIFEESTDEKGVESWQKVSELGVRNVFLNDLSPAASFIAHNYNFPVNPNAFEKEANRVLSELLTECNWMYETTHSESINGVINYTVWTDVFECNQCSGDVIYWDRAVDEVNGKVEDNFSCEHCNSELTKKSVKPVMETIFDSKLGQTVEIAKQWPVRINYSVGNKRYDKRPDSNDFEVIEKIKNLKNEYWYPTNKLIDGRETKRNIKIGIERVHQFYTSRNLYVLSCLLDKIGTSTMAAQLLCLVGDQLPRASKMHKIAVSRLNTNLSKTSGVLAGTLYVPSNQIEYCVLSMIRYRIKDVTSYLSKRDIGTKQVVSTSSTKGFDIPDNSVDYLFFDPPFGANLNYSELNCNWESWIKVWTNVTFEAVENKSQGKDLDKYRSLMSECFKKAYRVLKPGRWMTVEFSNTKSSVWNNIQTAMSDAGFIVANVSALDKKQGSFKSVTTSTAVKQDLVISVYKPDKDFEERFKSEPASDGVWDFVKSHLEYLPIVKYKGNEILHINERDARVLYDRVISFFIKNNREVPINSAEFQAQMKTKFVERDGMFFNFSQAATYDKQRALSGMASQLSIFVDDEASAISWMRQELNSKPKTYSEIHPLFLNELSGWKKNELELELSTLLEQNFIKYDGKDDVPSQIHTYLSTNFKDMRGLDKGDARLVAKAKDRWYVPDPNKASDLEKVRLRALLREFETYKGVKKVKQPRAEALRAGFNTAWEAQNYQTILDIAAKIPPAVLQEDEKLLMFYDNALTLSSPEDDEW